jgi:hypothetical protein
VKATLAARTQETLPSAAAAAAPSQREETRRTCLQGQTSMRRVTPRITSSLNQKK